ncbi:hypothetical protein BU23DRAFT_193489 [Bimuria novae-zelandiae CBS 107.79]|uniref:Uncharacterized protein n=1 Tax=Bimuria novae-zelandiae CBS 107.79 TaxID=1447943 RepID=A0A6A5VQ15_9PLEO|nr:hypothetical protein BU23DRAFT_193489 [Bimuria novae-zelandiae CBS 107.79]
MHFHDVLLLFLFLISPHLGFCSTLLLLIHLHVTVKIQFFNFRQMASEYTFLRPHLKDIRTGNIIPSNNFFRDGKHNFVYDTDQVYLRIAVAHDKTVFKWYCKNLGCSAVHRHVFSPSTMNKNDYSLVCPRC